MKIEMKCYSCGCKVEVPWPDHIPMIAGVSVRCNDCGKVARDAAKAKKKA